RSPFGSQQSPARMFQTNSRENSSLTEAIQVPLHKKPSIALPGRPHREDPNPILCTRLHIKAHRPEQHSHSGNKCQTPARSKLRPGRKAPLRGGRPCRSFDPAELGLVAVHLWFHTTRAPAAGTSVIARLRFHSPLRHSAFLGRLGCSSCSIVRNIVFISNIANDAPMQRLMPPPNGIHANVSGARSRKRSGLNCFGFSYTRGLFFVR